MKPMHIALQKTLIRKYLMKMGLDYHMAGDMLDEVDPTLTLPENITNTKEAVQRKYEGRYIETVKKGLSPEAEYYESQKLIKDCLKNGIITCAEACSITNDIEACERYSFHKGEQIKHDKRVKAARELLARKQKEREEKAKKLLPTVEIPKIKPIKKKVKPKKVKKRKPFVLKPIIPTKKLKKVKKRKLVVKPKPKIIKKKVGGIHEKVLTDAQIQHARKRGYVNVTIEGVKKKVKKRNYAPRKRTIYWYKSGGKVSLKNIRR